MAVQDPFNPVLRTAPQHTAESTNVTEEQKYFIRKVIEIGSSDSKFAEKMYVAIEKILLHPVVAP